MTLTLAEEHVPYAQHRRPGQRATEYAHEPLDHVQRRVHLLLFLWAQNTTRRRQGTWYDTMQQQFPASGDRLALNLKIRYSLTVLIRTSATRMQMCAMCIQESMREDHQNSHVDTANRQ